MPAPLAEAVARARDDERGELTGNVIFLDFDGDYVSSWLSYHPGTVPAYNLDGDPARFNAQASNTGPTI